MTVLVTGGAGYIGSHMTKSLLDSGHQVIVLDNLSTGYREAVIGGEFVQGNIADRSLLTELFTIHQVDAVMHFASFIEVGESVGDPGKYYRNNVVDTICLLDSMVQHDVQHFVFSSSAAVFGDPIRIPIDELHPTKPINPYGWTKLIVEQVLSDYDRAYGLKSVCLRYFNAAGADPSGRLGERHDPESHLIPLVLQAASGQRENIAVFGTDYETPDGTCIRDYIHVVDLCQAHLLALEQLQTSDASTVFNLGNGQGYSVRELIETSRHVTGRDIKSIDSPRRAGDPARLVADASRARSILGWQPEYGDLETIIRHAWQWMQKE